MDLRKLNSYKLMDKCTSKMARYYMELEFGRIKNTTIADEINVINQYRYVSTA